MGLRITGRRQNGDGANTHYRLSDGRIVTRGEAVRIRRKGLLTEYHVYKRKGIAYLRDNPDSHTDDNINQQPLI